MLNKQQDYEITFAYVNNHYRKQSRWIDFLHKFVS